MPRLRAEFRATASRRAGNLPLENGNLEWIIGVAGYAAHLVEGAVSAGFLKRRTRFSDRFGGYRRSFLHNWSSPVTDVD